MAKENKKSKRLEMAEEGVLNSQYTQNSWFVKVKVAYAIERVVFSFVKKGKQGSGFDIYVDMFAFDIWADDILNGTLARVIAAEKKAGEEYPKTYKFVTGDKGQKSVGFAMSSSGNGYVVNGSIVNSEGKREYGNVPVDYMWLRILAKNFKRTSEAHFSELAKITVEASTKFHGELGANDEATASVPEEAVNTTDTADAKNETSTQTSADANANKAAKTSENASVELKQAAVFVCSTPQKTERGYEAEAYTKKKDGSKGKTKLTLIIKSDSKITKEEYMNIYNATTEHSDVLLSFMGYADPADKTILFLESLTA